jgi:hypothetical protein
MNTRGIVLTITMLCAIDAAGENMVRSTVSIYGGRWQVGSDASTSLYLESGAKANIAYIGHGHTLQTTNLYQYRNPKSFGTVMSSLAQTAPLNSPLPNGCNDATVTGQSYDSSYPAGGSWASAGPLCFYSTITPYQYYDDSSDPDDGKESPIIVDVTGHGYQLTAARDGVRFDIRNDGKPIQIAWTAASSGNAFLAMDRNGNGTIDNGAELFGSRTPLQSGTTAPTGFHALAELDANGDMLIDASDAAWPNLLLWNDRNHDGQSAANELQSVASSTVSGFELDFRRVGREDRWANDFRLISHARFGDERRSYYDVWLVTRDRVTP